ncbi:hypothetical protein Nepgr_002056 [Nepenthes gracilis]|uniref:Protein kinase domain-containing protein n=1 Tax=Nepenthes gracilis TaxID=150966 RepID=A0AAD3P9I2_NEPGR|nr:hypothetical protein Nepgr_002056 [Nepenthes gracilis]
MGYLCNADSAIATCDPYNWPEKTKKKKNHSRRVRDHSKPIQLRQFSISDLEAATNGFSPRSLLGKGSHGAVYKAVLDDGKLVVAVKKSTTSTPTTADYEIEILSKIRSPMIVNLIGYAVDPRERKLLLVVEYMPNGSLYDLLHKNPRPPGWLTRLQFALQVAKAVQMLHGSEPPVIHRDIKSSNVLVDGKGKAKLSDFGLALRGRVEDVRVLSTPPAGTLGYLDPSYLAPGDLSTKNDVFSFGILLLEMISGRRAIDVSYSPPSVVEWALPLIKSGAHREILDPRIGCPGDPTVSRHLGVLAVRCVRSTAEKRPLMAEVVDCLRVVYKRVQAPIWDNLRRRVRRVGESTPLARLDFSDVLDGEEQGRRVSRHGSKRSLSTARNRRISSVQITDQIRSAGIEKPTDGGNRAVRSKSAGSIGEITAAPEVKGRHQVAVKMTTVRLSKSRSTGLPHAKNPQQVKNSHQIIKERDVAPLLANAVQIKRESPRE